MVRHLTTFAPALLAVLQWQASTVTAFGMGQTAVHHQLMADMGLNPDGTPVFVPDEDEWLRRRRLQRRDIDALAAANETIVPEYVTLKLDHFSKDNSAGYFKNRYWVSTAGYQPGGPVFLYDVGEANATGSDSRLTQDSSFFKQMVYQFGGVGIVWEHRYYGESSPVNISTKTPATDFKYLTTEQALADVVDFAAQFSRTKINRDLTPKGTPWVFVGGSYPAMRAAFMRELYPDTIYASYASSAPVQASIDMSFYFDPIWDGLNAYGFGNCTKDVQAAVRYMDRVMDTDLKATAKLKVQFLGRGAGNSSNAGFADALSTIITNWQSYGIEGGATGMRSFCDFISTDPATNTTAPASGWAPTKGVQFTVDRWSKWPSFARLTNNALYTDCEGYRQRPANATQPNCNLDGKFTDPAAISWTWQYCTQWGFFQSVNEGSKQIVSKYNSLVHQHDVCHRQFPDGRKSGLLPEWPAVQKTNAHFGGWDIRPSNTYWSGGQFDPWRTLSPLSQRPDAPHPNLTQNPPQCGCETDEDTLFGYVIPNAEHCFDFRTVGLPVPVLENGAASRGFFVDALTLWLKCWNSKTVPKTSYLGKVPRKQTGGNRRPGYGSGRGGQGSQWRGRERKTRYEGARKTFV